VTRRICFVLTTRGNFAKTKTVMQAVVAHPALELQVVAGGNLLSRQRAVLEEIAAQGFKIDAELDYMLAAETPAAIATSAGLCLIKMVAILETLRPDVVFVIADRYEALAITQAALYCNIRIAHLEGGEVSGSIDERIRHAISKLAHYHFPANAAAAERLLKMGEAAETVKVVGSPSFDLLAKPDEDDLACLRRRLDGAAIDLAAPFLLVSQHPVVTEFDETPRHYRIVMDSIARLGMPTVCIWPNNDAGADALQPALDSLQSRKHCPPVAVVPALQIAEYGAALRAAACLLGNSSSGLRESAFLGTPVVNIGSRQRDRERAANVVDVVCETEAIVAAVQRQVAHGRYPPDYRYGDGTAGEKIAAVLAEQWPPLDKRLVL
jgi:UDP-hydrolysing UDP-N-acetyl-D-glucosamine 2-epimerase